MPTTIMGALQLVSIHADLRRGRRRHYAPCSRTRRCFNPRRPPKRSATRLRGRSRWGACGFNPRRPPKRSATRCRRRSWALYSLFQSTPTSEEVGDATTRLVAEPDGVSIHADLRRGRRRVFVVDLDGERAVSIHADLRRGRRPPNAGLGALLSRVSIHADLRRGRRRCRVRVEYTGCGVSIHADLRRGRRRASRLATSRAVRFQSTPTSEEVGDRRSHGGSRVGAGFNPRRPPKRSATRPQRRPPGIPWFQSTPTSEEVGDHQVAVVLAGSFGFNPRRPPKRSATCALPRVTRCVSVSIHADLRRGRRRRSRTQATGPNGFNPRRPPKRSATAPMQVCENTDLRAAGARTAARSASAPSPSNRSASSLRGSSK